MEPAALLSIFFLLGSGEKGGGGSTIKYPFRGQGRGKGLARGRN